MGNRHGRRKQAVEDQYTRPQGLYQHRDIDHRKLRKLILDSKLAPCYPGDDDRSATPDLEECPICFLYYPSLNRSSCCAKGICTECFLQMKPPHSMRPTQCPFCKTCNYAVEYRGERSKEEKGKEQIEEQMVIEAKIRMQQQELQEEEERRMQKKEAVCSASQVATLVEVECRDMSVPSQRCESLGYQLEPSQSSRAYTSSRQTLSSRHNREDEFDLDLEKLMVMEAIWLSIQDHSSSGPVGTGAFTSAASSLDERYASPILVPAESSSSTGLVCAAAALAEHQHFGEGSAALPGASSFHYGALPRMGCMPTTGERLVGHYAPENWVEPPSDRRRAVRVSETDWAADLRPAGMGADVAEEGNGYGSTLVDGESGSCMPDGLSTASGHLVHDSFEEQMMLAMAVSLADARPRTNTPGVMWM